MSVVCSYVCTEELSSLDIEKLLAEAKGKPTERHLAFAHKPRHEVFQLLDVISSSTTKKSSDSFYEYHFFNE